MTNTRVRDTVSTLETALVELTDRVQRLTERAERTERTLERTERLARGTLEVPVNGASPPVHVGEDLPKPPPVVDITPALEGVLRQRPCSAFEAALALGVKPNAVTAALRALAKAGRISNVGLDTEPRWSWVIGDDTPTPELRAHLMSVLETGAVLGRAFTLRELVEVTGARRNRITGALSYLGRTLKAPIVNRGNGYRARWTLARPSEGVEVQVVSNPHLARKRR